MESHPRIAELLVGTGAYTDLKDPVILTSGALGIYYINTEKLLQDNGEFKQYGNDSQAMIEHALRMAKEHPTFQEVINILSEKAGDLSNRNGLVAGGQRRDWPFSGPVARQLGVPHLSLYKNGEAYVINPNGKKVEGHANITGMTALPIVDLITEGSSIYRIEGDKIKGWIPMTRRLRASVLDLMAVVDRLQGGKEMLEMQGIDLHSQVFIDDDFLTTHSTDPARALDYSKDPEEWSINYLQQEGALALIGTFDPKAGKLDRAKKFLTRYDDVLAKSGRKDELDGMVQGKYGGTLDQIMSGV